MARKLSLGLALIWVLWVPAISRGQTAPAASASSTPSTTSAATPTATASPTVPSATVGVPPIPDPALQILSAPVNGLASPSSRFTPEPVDPDALATSCAFEDPLDVCALQW